MYISGFLWGNFIQKPKPCHAYCCLNTSKILSALDPAIHTGIPIIGCMAQITNISSSADSSSMVRSMTSSEDEDDINNQHNFLTPSLDINFSTKNDVVNQCTTIEIHQNDSDSINTDLSQMSTINTPQYDAYINLSTSSSEASLARPLLSDKHQNTKDTKINSPLNPNDSLTSNYCSFIKFYFTDMIVSAFIITPLVNIHWRGAWDLLDINLLPSNERTSALISLGIGLMILYFMYLIQNYLQTFYEKHRKNIFGQIMTRFYTLIIALAYINQWRGLWNLLDLTSNIWYHLLIETLISVTCLLIMKSIYSLNSAPFLIGVDTESYFILGSKYNFSTNRFWQYTFDFVFYEIVEAPFVVIAWRGLYNLSDLYICPDNKSISMLISFTIGYSFFFLLALLQIPIIQCLIKHHQKLIYSIISNIFHLIAFISVVQIWRSLWMMCEQYLNIPGYSHLTLWICYVGAYALLTCGLTSCSLNGPGGGKDNYLDGQPILLYKFDYFSTLLKSQSSNLKISKDVHLGPDSSSIETIMPIENPYRFEPP
ncbi:unnamed protein product [Rotaria socialis]|uniref:Transmembrane protein n=4 Tax=Rotaria socialis TaxID=392032 RepID=A0A817R019_9BILA|nr:unnamed protein product [Rotaria socialis]CAF3365610.1 unnamed protein product [Rotaria socialis]CAF3383647.1 unnamed protein product [Rotaria socialis]CAF3602659.1 unnamed protein product [Rotaria socialis]CAF4111597.1 unnamed protein product [Rotaria socialis]